MNERVKNNSVSAKEHYDKVWLDIERFFFENGIPFIVAISPSFTSMVED